MKLTTTVTELKEVEIDIEFPSYYKTSNYCPTYIKAINENSTLTLLHIDDYISLCMGDTKKNIDTIYKATQVTEEEFNEQFLKAMLQITDANIHVENIQEEDLAA